MLWKRIWPAHFRWMRKRLQCIIIPRILLNKGKYDPVTDPCCNIFPRCVTSLLKRFKACCMGKGSVTSGYHDGGLLSKQSNFLNFIDVFRNMGKTLQTFTKHLLWYFEDCTVTPAFSIALTVCGGLFNCNVKYHCCIYGVFNFVFIHHR